MNQDLTAVQRNQFPEELKKQITALGLEFRLMTQFTSFVAVEEMTVTSGGQPVKITVPVEMPEGVSYEGVFGEQKSSRGLTVGRMAGPKGKAMGGAYYMRRSVNAPVSAAQTVYGYDRKTASETEDTVVQKPVEPKDKLVSILRGLAEKVAKDGKSGTLTVGNLRVINYKVDVMIYLADTSAKTLAALKKLGFVQTAESKAVKLLIGTIDVRNLEDLAKLSTVLRVKPLVE